VRLQFRPALLPLLIGAAVATSDAQATRRLATVASLRQYPGYYHLQNVLVHGEFVEGPRVLLRGGERDIPVVLNDNKATTGLAEVRGQLIDVGRLEPNDPRLGAYDGPREPDGWPRPGEELVLNVTGVADAQLATTASIRGLALQPWRFEGQKVTVVGQFRGRNLFGDVPSAPAKSRYDFVLRSADAAVWVTDLRPRGKGFDLSVDARVDTGRWLQVTGTVSQDRGLVTIAGLTVAATAAPEAAPVEEETTPPPPLETAEVVFSSPYEGETDVPVASLVRIQFSRGIDPKTIAGNLRVTYVGVAPTAAAEAPTIQFEQSYDAGTRAVQLKFAQPLDAFRTVRIEVLEGLKAFDGAAVAPWILTFSVGG
jgi:hypothetical protein